MRKLLDRIGRRGPIVMALSAVVVFMSLQPFLGTDGWAGLGQWAGGLGAFFAAWAALDIAKQEARRENRREDERLRIEAHFVAATWNQVLVDQQVMAIVANDSKEPVLNVRLVSVRLFMAEVAWISAEEVREHVLLPGGRWNPKVAVDWKPPTSPDLETMRDKHYEIEIAFEDLGGTCWRRIGTRPPFMDETA
ncbi:MAG TPA: hypothetical protein VFG15_06265 [Amycolatopsis sp.]|nr:hypothetical protein [Amycolatopsis sp.]